MIKIEIKKSPSESQLLWLEQHFKDLGQLLDLSEEKILELWEDLCVNYNEPHRYYHNLVHIFNLLQLYEEHQTLIEDKVSFLIAIWWHDIIYNPKRKDNEWVSADLAQEIWNALLSKTQLNQVDAIIRSTAGHQPLNQTKDLLLFLDFDLSVLAADDVTYQLYSAAIWEEYRTVYPKPLYKFGRKKALKHFLSRETLFLTEEFKTNCEKVARCNIIAELDSF